MMSASALMTWDTSPSSWMSLPSSLRRGTKMRTVVSAETLWMVPLFL